MTEHRAHAAPEHAAPPPGAAHAKHPAAAAAPDAGAAAPAETHATAHGHRSLAQRLNPLNWFRKETPESLVLEGERLAEAHNLNQALLAFNKALELDAHCADAYRGLGKVTLMKGGKTHQQEALGFYHQAARLDPFADSTYQAMALLYERLGQRNEALLERKKLAVVKTLQVEPDNPVANNNMGILFLQQEHSAQAIEYFSKAIAARPNYDVAHRNLAATYYKLALASKEPGEKTRLTEQALEAVDKALALGESAPNLIILARVQLLAGHQEVALEALERAQALEPAHKEIYALQQIALEQLGRMTDAQRAYESFKAYSKGDPPP